MSKHWKKSLKKAAVSGLVLAQIATCGIMAAPMTASAADTPRNVENLDRGVVAVASDNGVFVSWRRLATEPADTTFALYRNQEKIAEGAITNFEDTAGTAADKYTVVKNGETMSSTVSVWDKGYLEIPMAEAPVYEGEPAINRGGVYTPGYTPGDSYVADLDGDGQYEIIVIWNPDDAKDAASTGQTGKVYLDAYKLDGTHMWRIDMGYNIRAGQHDTMVMAADFDNDGGAEIFLRTADGTTDSAGNVVGDAERSKDYASSWAAMNAGKNLQGPLYMTCFDGDGTIIDTTNFYLSNEVGSNSVSLTFGDDFGNRSERYNGTVAYINGQTPSAIIGRGYYGGKAEIAPGRLSLASYSLQNGKIVLDWSFDTQQGDNAKYIGQGNHNMEAGDADGDGKDEVFLGSIAFDDDGSILWCSGLGHGDAMHLGDFDPTNEGLEFMTVKEEGTAYTDEESANPDAVQKGRNPSDLAATYGIQDETGIWHNWGLAVQDAATGTILQAHNGVKDTGRGMIGNIGYKDSLYVVWGAGSSGYYDNTDTKLADLGLSMNGRIYWDGDLQDELQDHVNIQKWNDETQKLDTIKTLEGNSINGTKGNVNAQADILGDWREEIVTYAVTGEEVQEAPYTLQGDPADPWTDDQTPTEITTTLKMTTKTFALRVYTTDIPTEYNFYTLMHDGVYRNSASAYGNCYNQPPHIGWYMNDKIADSQYTTQPAANVNVVANNYTEAAFDESALPADTGVDRPETPSDNPFTDIEGHWAKDYVLEMYNAGIVNGMTETTYEPDSAVTKGQFTQLIAKALGLELRAQAEGEHWATPAVEAANAASIIDSNIVMNVDDPINREEMASMVTNAAASKGVDVSGGSVDQFTDKDQISAWAVEDVAGAVKLGIVTGITETTFEPASGATRGQAATMLSRLLAAIG